MEMILSEQEYQEHECEAKLIQLSSNTMTIVSKELHGTEGNRDIQSNPEFLKFDGEGNECRPK